MKNAKLVQLGTVLYHINQIPSAIKSIATTITIKDISTTSVADNLILFFLSVLSFILLLKLCLKIGNSLIEGISFHLKQY